MDEKQKKRRCTNFDRSEKVALLDLIEKYRHIIIDNKKTDNASIREKDGAFEALAIEFNVKSTIWRSKENLRMAWENIKKKAKKRAAQNNMFGGDPSEDPLLKRIITMLRVPIDGLANQYDSDSQYVFLESPPAAVIKEEAPIVIAIEPQNDVKGVDSSTENEADDGNKDAQSRWMTWSPMPRTLETPKTEDQAERDSLRIADSRNGWAKRRRSKTSQDEFFVEKISLAKQAKVDAEKDEIRKEKLFQIALAAAKREEERKEELHKLALATAQHQEKLARLQVLAIEAKISINNIING